MPGRADRRRTIVCGGSRRLGQRRAEVRPAGAPRGRGQSRGRRRRRACSWGEVPAGCRLDLHAQRRLLCRCITVALPLHYRYSGWTCVPKASAIGDFGGGSLERLRPWLGPQWPGPILGECRAARGRQARSEEVQELSWGRGETFDVGAGRRCVVRAWRVAAREARLVG